MSFFKKGLITSIAITTPVEKQHFFVSSYMV